MTLEEYQKLTETRESLVEYNGALKCIPFVITPKSDILTPNELKVIGEVPYKIKNNDFNMKVLYPGGEINYYVEGNNIMPEDIVIYGVTREEGVRSLDTEMLDTTIVFIPVKEQEVNPENEYLHFADTHLEILRVEGDMDMVKEWWFSDRRG